MRILRSALKQLGLAGGHAGARVAGAELGMLKDMVAGLDPKELIELALLIAVETLSGFLAGVFGIGGGAILVPAYLLIVSGRCVISLLNGQ
jgi:hypothetical protein